MVQPLRRFGTGTVGTGLTASFAYSGLDSGIINDLRVAVTDKAGNIGYSNVCSTIALTYQVGTKGTKAIPWSVTGNSAEGGPYTFRAQTSTNEGNAGQMADKSNGGPWPLLTSGLKPYTSYIFLISVEANGKKTTIRTTVKTKCDGTGQTCTGPFDQTKTICDNCGNECGTETCGLKMDLRGDGTNIPGSKTDYCPFCNKYTTLNTVSKACKRGHQRILLPMQYLSGCRRRHIQDLPCFSFRLLPS